MESKLSKRVLLGELIDLGVNPKNIAEVEQRLKKVEKRPGISVGGGGFSPVQTVNGQKPDNYGNVSISVPSPTVYTFIYLRDGLYKYVCKAPVGTETFKPEWRIFRAPMEGTAFSYAEGDPSYSYVADDAVSYFYP